MVVSITTLLRYGTAVVYFYYKYIVEYKILTREKSLIKVQVISHKVI